MLEIRYLGSMDKHSVIITGGEVSIGTARKKLVTLEVIITGGKVSIGTARKKLVLYGLG
jgi:hypothetical protein